MTSLAREVVIICNSSQARMQAVADLLLLTSDLRPVMTDSLAVFRESYSKCRETVITRTNGLLVLTGKVKEQLHNVMSRRQDICICIEDACELIIGLIECCAHAAYLVAVSRVGCIGAKPGVVDSYKLRKACVEIEVNCCMFKQAAIGELTPPVLVQICSDLNRNLTVLTECCKIAAEQCPDIHQEQFRLCVKSSTAAASCLLMSIRAFKAVPTDAHFQRCVSFYDSLVAATKAAVNFATEEQFVGNPAVLVEEAVNIKKSILGACLSVVSSVIQLCRTIKELAYNTSNSSQRDKVLLCFEAISKSSSQLAEALLQHNVHVFDYAEGQNSHVNNKSFHF